MMTRKHDIIPATLLILFTCIGFGCSEESIENDGILPVREKIPYHDRDHVPIDTTRSFDEFRDKPPQLALLERFFQNPGEIEMDQMNVTVSDPLFGLSFSSITSERILILDEQENLLIEYNLTTHAVDTIAESGEGPGDLQFPRDLIRQDDVVYVARQDFYLSRFDCRTAPCVFDEAISIEFRPVSLTPVGDSLTVLGPTGIRPDDTHRPVRYIDMAGNILGSFGDAYAVEGPAPIMSLIVRKGWIRYSTVGGFILVYNRFPFIYQYDAFSHDLTETYELTDFMLAKYMTGPNIPGIRNPVEDHNEITTATIINEKILFIETLLLANYKQEVPPWDFYYDYYALDLRTKESYYLGRYENSADHPGKRFFPTEHGLIIYDYTNGNLYWVGL